MSDHRILARIAWGLGFEAAFTEGRTEMAWIEALYAGYRERHPELPAFAEFWERGFAGLDLEHEAPSPATPLAAFATDPERHPLSTPSGRIELTSSAIAGFRDPDGPGHPAWMPAEEWLGAPLAARFPLHLLSPQPAHRLHSQLEHAGPSQAAKVAGLEPVRLHPEDAAARGIHEGDAVELFNDCGRVLAGARLAPGLLPGTVVLQTGGWFDPVEIDGGTLDRGGNPNTLTADRPTSALSQAPAPNSCLVEVRLAP